MPWTKINYPASMKNLPAPVRNKAIEIANAILKENKKMKEGMLIATAIKHAKDMAVKSGKKTKSAVNKKTKNATEKKVKSKAVKKRKIALAEKTKNPSKNKAKIAAKKKIKSPEKNKIKNSAKKVKSSAKNKAKSIVRKETKKTDERQAENPVTESSLPEIITHGEDLHFIPEKGETRPVTAFEVHRVENKFHHREEVAFHQENQKVMAAMPSRKNAKRTYRMTGRR